MESRRRTERISEVDPLIHSAVHNLAELQGEEAVTKRNRLRKKANFVDGYWNKRAQAEYVNNTLHVGISRLTMASLRNWQTARQCFSSDLLANIHISLCGFKQTRKQRPVDFTRDRQLYQSCGHANRKSHGRGA